MIGMVLVTHGRLAAEFVSALEHVVGPQRNVRAICIGPEDDMEMRRAEILAAVAAADEGDGVAVLTDMFGGTPSNLAMSILGKGRVEVVAGMNLPMLIKLASVRSTMALDAAVVEARCAEFARALGLLEGFLDEAGPFATGPLPTLADCGFPPTLAIADGLLPMLGHAPAQGPRTTRWRAALAAEPRIESVMSPYRAEVARWLEARRGA